MSAGRRAAASKPCFATIYRTVHSRIEQHAMPSYQVLLIYLRIRAIAECTHDTNSLVQQCVCIYCTAVTPSRTVRYQVDYWYQQVDLLVRIDTAGARSKTHDAGLWFLA